MIWWREDLKQRWPVLVYSDPYTFAEWEQAIGEILQHQLWHRPRLLLVDRRHCSAPMTQFVRQLQSFLGVHRDQFAGARVAIVVLDTAGYGMARMTEILSEVEGVPMAIHAFHDWDEAERWLEALGA